MTENAAMYARVSTAQQEDGTSRSTQVEACVDLARSNQLEVDQAHVFEEQASGADRDRPLLNGMLKLAHAGQVQHVIVHSPDRFARDPLHLMMVTEDLAEHGVKLHFVQGPSGNTAEDKLVRYILGYVGQKEREFIAERTMRGKLSTARNNNQMPVGTGKGLYGYSYDAHAKRRSVVDLESAVVGKVFVWASQGVSCYQIAMRLNEQNIPTKGGSLWHPLTVKRMLTNSAYIGVDYYGKTKSKRKSGGGRTLWTLPKEEWVRIEGFTPPIIDESLFNTVQEALKNPSNRRGKSTTPYLITGFINCGDCGSPVVGAQLNHRYRY